MNLGSATTGGQSIAVVFFLIKSCLVDVQALALELELLLDHVLSPLVRALFKYNLWFRVGEELKCTQG